MSLNKVLLIGNVGADPEIRYLPNSQTKVARVRLATSERFTDRNGEQRENTEWHTVELWRNLADVVEQYVKKGSQIYVEGRIQTREWTDNTGNKRYSTEIRATDMQLLGRREGGNSGQTATMQNVGGYQQPTQAAQPKATYPQPAQSNVGGYQQPYQPAPAAPAAPAVDFGAEGDDDLPF